MSSDETTDQYVVHLCSIVEYVSKCIEKLKEEALCLPEMSEGISKKEERREKRGFAENQISVC